jgi:hypothetical protein
MMHVTGRQPDTICMRLAARQAKQSKHIIPLYDTEALNFALIHSYLSHSILIMNGSIAKNKLLLKWLKLKKHVQGTHFSSILKSQHFAH